jgi:hypothetical protein
MIQPGMSRAPALTTRPETFSNGKRLIVPYHLANTVPLFGMAAQPCCWPQEAAVPFASATVPGVEYHISLAWQELTLRVTAVTVGNR